MTLVTAPFWWVLLHWGQHRCKAAPKQLGYWALWQVSHTARSYQTKSRLPRRHYCLSLGLNTRVFSMQLAQCGGFWTIFFCLVCALLESKIIVFYLSKPLPYLHPHFSPASESLWYSVYACSGVPLRLPTSLSWDFTDMSLRLPSSTQMCHLG